MPQAQEGLTVIGPDIVVKGRVEGEEDLRIQGRVEGSILLSHTLYVEPGGIVVAQVEARDIVVSGIVVGNVTATNCITLHAGGRLVGDLAAPRVVIEDGAAFRGNVTMGEQGAAMAKSSGVARASRAPARASAKAAARPAAPKPAARAAAATAKGTTARIAAVPPTAAAEPRPRVAPIRATRPGRDDDEVTVVVRHAEVTARAKAAPEQADPDQGAEPDADHGETAKAAKKKAKKAPPRARMPKPGKRRISRR